MFSWCEWGISPESKKRKKVKMQRFGSQQFVYARNAENIFNQIYRD